MLDVLRLCSDCVQVQALKPQVLRWREFLRKFRARCGSSKQFLVVQEHRQRPLDTVFVPNNHLQLICFPVRRQVLIDTGGQCPVSPCDSSSMPPAQVLMAYSYPASQPEGGEQSQSQLGFCGRRRCADQKYRGEGRHSG
jgi:hypothetical protein